MEVALLFDGEIGDGLGLDAVLLDLTAVSTLRGERLSLAERLLVPSSCSTSMMSSVICMQSFLGLANFLGMWVSELATALDPAPIVSIKSTGNTWSTDLVCCLSTTARRFLRFVLLVEIWVCVGVLWREVVESSVGLAAIRCELRRPTTVEGVA